MTFYRYLLVGLVLCGCAWGQEAVLSSPVDNDLTVTNVTVGSAYCDRMLTMGNSTKKFSEIFPEECSPKTPHFTAIAEPIGTPDTRDWPTVVPAIEAHAPDEDFEFIASNPAFPWCRRLNGEIQRCEKLRPQTYWQTCADKSRVLLTTEEGKKICVKF
jgi:hypothetical protein